MNAPAGPPMGPPPPSQIPDPPSQYATNLAEGFAGAAISLNIIAFLVFSGRIWTRSYPVFRLQWDDYIFTVAYILVLVDSVLLLAAIPWVFGKDPATVSLADVEEAFRLALLAQPIWTWSMAAIKIGVAAMLLRLQQQLIWRQFLWAMVVIQLIMAFYNTFAQLLQCIPLRGAWDLLHTGNAKCWSNDAIRTSSIAVSAINIVTDIIFSLIPITFLRKVQRPLRERIIIGGLMGLGLFASGCSIAKVVAAAKFGRTDDPTGEGIAVGMWSCIEELVGFIAACIPCLKSPFQRVLVHFGLISMPTKTTTYGGSSYGQMGGGRSTTGRSTTGRSKSGTNNFSLSSRDTNGYPGAIRLKGLKTKPVSDSQSEDDIIILGRHTDPGKRAEIWCTTEVQMMEERLGSREADVESQILGTRRPPGEWSGEGRVSDAERWVESQRMGRQ